MTTSQKAHFLSEFELGEPIPEEKIAYLEQRVLNNFYAYVVNKFLSEQAHSNLSKAELGRRINRGADQVNRWLASPGNWTISTLARLLLGISGEEAFLTSTPLLGRPPHNQTVFDLLEDDYLDNQVTGSGSDTFDLKIERLDA